MIMAGCMAHEREGYIYTSGHKVSASVGRYWKRQSRRVRNRWIGQVFACQHTETRDCSWTSQWSDADDAMMMNDEFSQCVQQPWNNIIALYTRWSALISLETGDMFTEVR